METPKTVNTFLVLWPRDHLHEEDSNGSRENLLQRRNTNGSGAGGKEAWPNPNFEVAKEEPETIKALLIMKAMEKSRSKVKKRAKYNWNVSCELDHIVI